MTNHDELPLAGLKVLDFTWVMAGPAITRYLADYGATVVKIESGARVETGRTLGPYWKGGSDPEQSAFMADNNAGKLGISLDCSTEAGRAIALRLAAWADVVAESFTPKVMRSWGLDYDALKQVNPGLVMLSTSLSGLTGPNAQFAGFGTLGAALAGFVPFAQWPGRAPAGPLGAYTDYVAPKFGVAALMAALDYRRRTGTGQHIDLSQAEASIHFIGPAVLDYVANGRLPEPVGNTDPVACPHGVYRCQGSQGSERWVAIAVVSEAQWQALRRVVAGLLDEDPRFATLVERRRNNAALDEAINAWTKERTAEAVEQELHHAGVPVSRVLDTPGVFADEQLNPRRHFIEVPHAVLGKAWVQNSRTIMRSTPAVVSHAGPALGQHTDGVLQDILGMTPDEIADAVVIGAIH